MKYLLDFILDIVIALVMFLQFSPSLFRMHTLWATIGGVVLVSIGVLCTVEAILYLVVWSRKSSPFGFFTRKG